jgi:hypothetical protein
MGGKSGFSSRKRAEYSPDFIVEYGFAADKKGSGVG